MLEQWDKECRLPSRFVSGEVSDGNGKGGRRSKGRSLRRNSI